MKLAMVPPGARHNDNPFFGQVASSRIYFCSGVQFAGYNLHMPLKPIPLAANIKGIFKVLRYNLCGKLSGVLRAQSLRQLMWLYCVHL